MRLLRLEENGAFSLVEYVGKDVPPYAILSHTWGADNEEPTFKDVAEGTGKNKTGYRKLIFCGKQAAKDGLHFFWVDTCCIDKSSSTELTEAINSMFRWYQRADKCYAYLSDVSFSSFANKEQSFQKSRWFTRGWTLQELVAPNSVEFFSSEGERIGDKNSMLQELHSITKIPVQALQAAPLSQFSVDERMSWADRRVTKREEDAAYSLLGIFNTYMPLLYGEGRENAFNRLHREIKFPKTVEAAEIEAAEERRKYRIPFSLKGVPTGKFADRQQDTVAMDRALLPLGQSRRRRILVAHGLGGAGKTQLAADFARRNQHSFSSVLWLDGSSESSLKQSIAACASRIPVGQIAENSRMYTSGQGGDLDVAVRDVLHWLSIPNNDNWLVVVDNVDRDYMRRDEDIEAYNVEEYLPEADHGSVLITTRLPYLGQLGERWEVNKVDEDQARAIFEVWYGRGLGHDSEELLRLLDGLPLALAQAAAYMSETGTSFDTYTRLYKEQWRELMAAYVERHMPLRSYANGSVATTWMISYMSVRKKNEAAANLLLLWAHLDNKSLWHGLFAAASQNLDTVAKRIPAWLIEIAHSEIDFIEAIRMLRSYSLVEEMDDRMGYATHPVVHQWALHIQDDSQRTALSWLAIVLVGSAVPMIDTKKYWETQVRLLPHAKRCEKRIEEVLEDGCKELGIVARAELEGEEEEEEEKEDEWHEEEVILLWVVQRLAILYRDQGKLYIAEKMYQRVLQRCEKAWGPEHTATLGTVNDFGLLYVYLGRLGEAEKMYQRALQGYEKAWGLEHTATLGTVNNFGVLYVNLGRLNEAEKMYQRALQGYEKAWGLEHTLTLNTVNNLGLLYSKLGRLDKAEKMYQRALQGREKALGPEHTSTLGTVNDLGLLYSKLGRLNEVEKMYQRALQGYEKAIGPEGISTHIPALNTMCRFASLSSRQGQVEDARFWYSEALSGYQKVFGNNYPQCQVLRDSLAALDRERDQSNALGERVLVQERTHVQTIVNSCSSQNKSASRQHKLLIKFG